MGRRKKDGSKLKPGICKDVTLREESSGMKDMDVSSILKIKHLQRLATWAGGEGGVPPLGALFGHKLAANAEALGILLDHSSFCCERGNAMTMKKMLETSFPGIEVILVNYPPPLPKRLLSKIVPIFQVGAIAIVTAGDQIFPRLGFAVPPPWYFSLRSNKFGAIATTWLIGNFMQSFLQSSGAFEVYCNGDLVFSKLMEHRFPSEYELRELIRSRLPDSIQEDKVGSIWS